MREIIKVKNVSKVYKINKRKSGLFGAVLNLFAPRYEKKIAVSDMNFSIEEGEAVAFIGSNGAGKSTTIKMLSGILYPSEGEITVASYVPYKQRKKYVSNIGVVLGQKSQLVWDLPVRDGYELIRHIYKISKEDYEKRLDEFIEMLDMKEFINQPVRQLSLGQKMRAEIVATMLHNPKIIFLDEPTIGLDLVAKKKIQDFIRTINKKYNVTIIFTTHDMQDIVSTCERLIIIDKGKKIYDGFIKKNSGGFVSLEGDAVILYEFFDNEFRKIAEKLDAKEERYPILLGIDTMKDTGYYRRSPQYTMFCSDVTEDFEDLEKMSNASFVDKNLDEVIQIPSFSLSPSACFHVYEKYRGQTMPQNSVITLNQSVFRNEGRLNWEEFGRLRDYHVREIVFLGTQEFVEQTRENIREEVMTFIRKMNMDAYITVAADAFIMPKMIKYKKYQKMEKSKYEVRVSYDKDHTLAAASLNLHGTAFTSPFHIKVKGVDNPVSGCVGFGIERWILVFLAQYGTDSACWPDEVKKFIRQKG